MKSTILALAAIAGVVSAQFPGIPECAQACLTSAISSVGCPITDVGCQCSSTAEIQGAGAGCILGACTAPGELNSAISGGLGLCSAYLATVSASTTPAAATTTSTAVVTETSTAETSTVTAETTSIPTPSITASPNSTVIGTGGVTPTSTPSQVPVNGANNLVASIGGFAALAIGVLAAVL